MLPVIFETNIHSMQGVHKYVGRGLAAMHGKCAAPAPGRCYLHDVDATYM